MSSPFPVGCRLNSATRSLPGSASPARPASTSRARLVDAGRAGDADPGNDLVAEFNRQPTGNGDDIGQRYLLAHHRVVVGEALGVGGGGGAKAARGIGFAPSVLHRMGASIVGAHRDDDVAGAVDHDG